MVVTRRLMSGLLAFSLSICCLHAPATAKQQANVLPPTAKVGGLSINEWAARWWQWAYSLPATNHPLSDTTGASATFGQTGNVWFLAGSSSSGNIVRNVTIPSGTFLFFPVMNVNDNRMCLGETPVPVEQLRQELRDFITFTNLSAEIDGAPVTNIQDYFEESVVFSVTIPEDHIFCSAGTNGPGTYGPVVDVGYYLMVPPLSVGQHQIHFHGTTFITLDITYNITVVPAGRYEK